MVNQAISEEKNLPRGSVEAVPSRTGVGIGLNINHPRSPTDDPLTDKRRSHFGEDENHPIQTHIISVETNVNQVPLKNNVTRDDVIQGKVGVTGFGRAMSQ